MLWLFSPLPLTLDFHPNYALNSSCFPLVSFPPYISPLFHNSIPLLPIFRPVLAISSFFPFLIPPFSSPSPSSPSTSTSYCPPLFYSPCFSPLPPLSSSSSSTAVHSTGGQGWLAGCCHWRWSGHYPLSHKDSHFRHSSISPVVSITLLPGLASEITLHCRSWTRGQCH